MNIDRIKQIKYLLKRCESLRDSMIRTLNDNSTAETGRYSAFKTYSQEYEYLAQEVVKIINVDNENIKVFNTSKMKGSFDTPWPFQKEIIDSTLVFTDILIALLYKEVDFIEDEYTNLENFIKNGLRKAVFDQPQKEKDVQNTIEMLFVGKGWQKGIDYDRESGKFEFSGREYIPDFVVSKLNLCIEVKLLKEVNRKSKMIEEINADITAYSKCYKRIMFVIYDLGCIQNEVEFRRDIENAKEDIKVIIVKH